MSPRDALIKEAAGFLNEWRQKHRAKAALYVNAHRNFNRAPSDRRQEVLDEATEDLENAAVVFASWKDVLETLSK